MSDELQNPNLVEEPSVLDYVKSVFKFGRGERISLYEFVAEEQVSHPTDEPLQFSSEKIKNTSALMLGLPWRSLLALILALIGQTTFEPPLTSATFGYVLYAVALGLLGWAIYSHEWNLPSHDETLEIGRDPLTYRRLMLFVSVVLSFMAYTLFGGNLYTRFNVLVWLAAVALFIGAFWVRGEHDAPWVGSIVRVLRSKTWTVHISYWTLLLIGATILVFFFRFAQTEGIPAEPFSDHAEKLLDIYDVTHGKFSIFFIRSTGREGFQMYWTAFVAWVFGTGLTFFSLKLGTAILGFLTLPFIYLLGKEIGGKRVGLLAFVLTGIGYWPNVISRIGLRFPLYPLFTALTLFFLIRGLQTRNRNDFLLSGFFLGVGLHAYSPMRVVPIVIVTAIILYWLHSRSKGIHADLTIWLMMLAMVSIVVFLPLLRYSVDNPGDFSFGAMTRLPDEENLIAGPILKVFFSNVWNGLLMFNFDDGDLWVNSVTHRPAFDIVSATLLVFGIVLVLVRYIRHRHWLDLFLLMSIPLLQLPSTLSLAFPGENPTLNRAGGAYIPAFIIAAMAFDGLLTSFGRGKMRTVLSWGVAGLLIYSSILQNYDLVFNQFSISFRQGTWNTTDMAKVIEGFGETYGRTDTAWVVPFPYWADTRLPAIYIGDTYRDMAMWRDDLPNTVSMMTPKLFIVKADLDHPEGNDQETLDLLSSLYPNGELSLFDSDIPGHDFWIFIVPN